MVAMPLDTWVPLFKNYILLNPVLDPFLISMLADHQSALLGGKILNDFQHLLDALFRLNRTLEIWPDLLKACKKVLGEAFQLSWFYCVLAIAY
jgi:hypothetical protein